MAAGGLACAQCGDPAPAVGAARVVRCPSCSALSFVENAPSPHLMCDPQVSRDAARSGVRAWLRAWRHREGLARRADIDEPKLVYLPFTRIEARVLGWLYGKRRHHEDKRTYYTDEEVEIVADHVTVAPLSSVGELGVERLPDLAGVALVPFDEAAATARGEVVPALESDTSAADRAHASFLDEAHTGHDLSSITGQDLSIVGARESVIHYPFWRVDYRTRGKAYVCVVDARTGAIAYGRAPGSLWFHTGFFGLMMPLGAALVVAAVLLAGVLFAVGSEAGDVSDWLAGIIFCGAALVGIGGIVGGGYCGTVAHRGLVGAGEVESGYGAHTGADLLDADEGDYGKARAAERAEVERDATLIALESQP